MDFPAIIEEIALEGLEGITLEALWKRLKDRPDFVEGALDEDSKRYIWTQLIRHKELQFFVLPEPRPELIIFKYNDYASLGAVKCALPTDVPPDIYSRTLVDKDGVVGCCDHFKTRKNITKEICGKKEQSNISLEDAEARWGQTLIIVASQKRRNLLLCGSVNPCPAEQYAFLEMIARARYDGEVTFCRTRRGLCNPQCKAFSLPSVTFSRILQLEFHGYITKQVFIMTYDGPHWVNQVRLVHLKRFHTVTNANFRGVIKSLNEYLGKMPNHMAPYYPLLKDLKMRPEIFHRVTKRVRSNFAVRNLTRKAYFGEDEVADKRCAEVEAEYTGSPELKVKTVTMVTPFQDTDKLEDDDDDIANEDAESTMEENDVEDDADKDTTLDDKDKAVLNRDLQLGYPSMDGTLLSQVVSIVYQSGNKGIKPATVMKRLNLSRYSMRFIDKMILQTKVVGTVQRSFGTVKVLMWVAPEVEKKESAKMSDERKAVTERTEKAVTSLADASCIPSEEVTISPEEVAALDARLKEIKVTWTHDKVEEKKSLPDKDDPRKANRKNFIMDNLVSRTVYPNVGQLYQDMVNHEKEQGRKERVCRKSLRRIIEDLHSEGRLEFLHIHLEGKPDLKMIILPGAGMNNAHTKKAVVEHATAKLKLKEVESHSKSKAPSNVQPQTVHNCENFRRHSAVANLGLISVYKMLTQGMPELTKKESEIKTKFNISKMERTESLHKYLHYLFYSYQGCQDGQPAQQDVLPEIDGPLPVYLDVDDWRRYLPPLQRHNESALKKLKAGPGTCMVGDLMLNMPMAKIWDMLNKSSELQVALGQFVEDPRLLQVPACRLPKHLLSHLMFRKRFLLRLQEDLHMLCYMGLLSYGPRQPCINLEFVSIYLHREAMLLDTRLSLPTYLMTRCPEGRTFPSLHYTLHSMKDITQYWTDLQIISLNSNMGHRKTPDIPGSHGEIVLTEASKPKSFEEIGQVTESEWLPGDHRGAGGLDSYLMAHRVRNWRRGMPLLKASIRLGNVRGSVAEPSSSKEKVKDTRKAQETGDEPLTKKKKMDTSKSAKTATPAVPCRMKRLKLWKNRSTRMAPQGVARPQKKYREFFDAKDRKAQKSMNRIRSNFTPLENGQLLLFQLAACVLNPRVLVVRVSVMRDIMHENLPESLDKTTAAIKGKISRLNHDRSYHLHLAFFIAQVKSDKALMAKYCRDLPPVLSPKMEGVFRSLVADLRAKFSSRRRASDLTLPISVQELQDSYTVVKTMNVIFESPKLSKAVENVFEVRSLVVAELIETFLHLDRPLSAMSVYFTLSKFSSAELEAAYKLLKLHNVIVQLKKYDKDQRRLVTNTAVLNNHKSKLAHRESLRCPFHKEIFINTNRMMELVQQCYNMRTPASTTTMTTNTAPPQPFGKSTTARAQTEDISTGRARMDYESSSSSGCQIDNASTGEVHSSSTPTDETHTDDFPGFGDNRGVGSSSDEGFVSLDVEDLQGGASMGVICLVALNMMSIDVHIPEEVVNLDSVGQRKLGLKSGTKRNIFKRGRVIRQPGAGKWGEEMSDAAAEKKRKVVDNETREMDESQSDVVSTRWAKADGPKTVSAKRSLEQQQRKMGRQNQAPGSTTSSDTVVGAATSNIVNTTLGSMEHATGTSSGTAFGTTSGLTPGTIPSPASDTILGSTGPTNANQADNVISLPSSTVTFNNLPGLDSTTEGFLLSYRAWVASNCLMTLARTSYIHRINLQVADCSLSRHFSLVPMAARFRLTVPCKNRTIKTKNKSAEVDVIPSTSMSYKSAEMTKDTQTDDNPVGAKSVERTEKTKDKSVPETLEKPVETFLETSKPQTSGSNNLKTLSAESPALQKGRVITGVDDTELFRALIGRIERYYQPSDLDGQVERAELESLLGVNQLEDGWRLYSVVDASGDIGIDERDLQAQVSLSWSRLRNLLNDLARGGAVLRAGYLWRRLVSRRHARPWLVEVTAPGWEGEIHLADESVGSVTRPPPPTVLYQTRPWRHFQAGQLNVSGLRRVMERVLTDVMIRPGQRITGLCRQLNPHILPVVTLDILEILEEIGCIQFVTLQTHTKFGFFTNTSRPVHISPDGDTNPWAVRVVEPTIEAPLRFANFLQAAKEHSTTAGFMEKEEG